MQPRPQFRPSWGRGQAGFIQVAKQFCFKVQEGYLAQKRTPPSTPSGYTELQDEPKVKGKGRRRKDTRVPKSQLAIWHGLSSRQRAMLNAKALETIEPNPGPESVTTQMRRRAVDILCRFNITHTQVGLILRPHVDDRSELWLYGWDAESVDEDSDHLYVSDEFLLFLLRSRLRNLFVDFLRADTNPAFGWLRDLLREGIEPNPGPPKRQGEAKSAEEQMIGACHFARRCIKSTHGHLKRKERKGPHTGAKGAQRRIKTGYVLAHLIQKCSNETPMVCDDDNHYHFEDGKPVVYKEVNCDGCHKAYGVCRCASEPMDDERVVEEIVEDLRSDVEEEIKTPKVNFGADEPPATTIARLRPRPIKEAPKVKGILKERSENAKNTGVKPSHQGNLSLDAVEIALSPPGAWHPASEVEGIVEETAVQATATIVDITGAEPSNRGDPRSCSTSSGVPTSADPLEVALKALETESVGEPPADGVKRLPWLQEAPQVDGPVRVRSPFIDTSDDEEILPLEENYDGEHIDAVVAPRVRVQAQPQTPPPVVPEAPASLVKRDTVLYFTTASAPLHSFWGNVKESLLDFIGAATRSQMYHPIGRDPWTMEQCTETETAVMKRWQFLCFKFRGAPRPGEYDLVRAAGFQTFEIGSCYPSVVRELLKNPTFAVRMPINAATREYNAETFNVINMTMTTMKDYHLMDCAVTCINTVIAVHNQLVFRQLKSMRLSGKAAAPTFCVEATSSRTRSNVASTGLGLYR